MHFSTIIASSALLGLALAEDHSVRVGGTNGELTFDPNSLTAAEGDTVTFNFWPKNHSVAQAAFNAPCQPLENGFWSGYQFTANGVAEDSFQVTITNASRPLWYYCTQGQHCQSGMVGVINPPSSGPNTIEAFASAARDADSNVTPQAEAGTGGNITHSDDHSPSATSSGSPSGTASGTASPATSSPGAAATLQLSKGVAFAGLFGLLGYLI
jgi:plastocyanin